MLETLLAVCAFLCLVFASISDIRTREVPDWLNYGLILAALGIRLIFSLALHDWHPIVSGLLGFVAFFLLANLMFYTAQWGGGDSKLLMGLGAVIGLDTSFLGFATIPPLLIFFINVMMVGAVYGLLFSVWLAFRKQRAFLKDFRQRIGKYILLRRIVLAASLIMLIVALLITDYQLRFFISVATASVLLMFYTSLFVKSIEQCCMLRWVPPEKLTEGDWIVNDIVINKKRICGPRDLGIEKSQIKRLIALKRRGLVKKVLIKEGIPFVPSFLIAYLITLFWNWLAFFL